MATPNFTLQQLYERYKSGQYLRKEMIGTIVDELETIHKAVANFHPERMEALLTRISRIEERLADISAILLKDSAPQSTEVKRGPGRPPNPPQPTPTVERRIVPIPGQVNINV